MNRTIGSPYKALERMLATSCRLPSNSMERKLACSEPSPLAISSTSTRTGQEIQGGTGKETIHSISFNMTVYITCFYRSVLQKTERKRLQLNICLFEIDVSQVVCLLGSIL